MCSIGWPLKWRCAAKLCLKACGVSFLVSFNLLCKRSQTEFTANFDIGCRDFRLMKIFGVGYSGRKRLYAW